jgi:hypothetical protein
VSYRVRTLGRGVGLLIPRTSLIGNSLQTTQTVRNRNNVCSQYTGFYLDDMSAASDSCSGFLLSADTFATAGTCVFDNNLGNKCSNLAVVFNYATTSPGNTRTTFGSSEVMSNHTPLSLSLSPTNSCQASCISSISHIKPIAL